MQSPSYQTYWEVIESILQSRADINSCYYTSFNLAAIYQMSYREDVWHDRVVYATENLPSYASLTSALHLALITGTYIDSGHSAVPSSSSTKLYSFTVIQYTSSKQSFKAVSYKKKKFKSPMPFFHKLKHLI